MPLGGVAYQSTIFLSLLLLLFPVGRVVDFHSLRHGFITYLVTANCPPKVVQMLAQHSTISLTMDRYTHLGMVDLVDGLKRLPVMVASENASCADNLPACCYAALSAQQHQHRLLKLTHTLLKWRRHPPLGMYSDKAKRWDHWIDRGLATACLRTIKGPVECTAMPDTDCVDLSILDSGSAGVAIAFARHGDNVAIELLRYQTVKELSHFRDRLAKAASGNGPRPAPNELSQFGRDLFGLAVKGSLAELYQHVPRARVSIHILSDQPDIQALPWEYIQERKHSYGPDNSRSVVRIVPMVEPNPYTPVPVKQTVRILFVYADPVERPGVSWMDVKDTIERQFRYELKRNVEITVVPSANKKALTSALIEGSYDFFHFCGHGDVADDGVGRITLVDFKTKRSQPLTAGDLGTILRGRGIQLAVLSACNTSAGNMGKPFAVVADTLVRNGIPAVVANQFAVTDSAVATFCGGFYESLLRSGNVDQAVSDGRAMLFTIGATNHTNIEWGIPTLYRRLGASVIFRCVEKP